MKTTLIEIIGIASMIVIIMQNSHLYAKLTKALGERKPFSCELCMCFWSHLIIVSIRHGITQENIINHILSSFICGVVGYIIYLKFVKWQE